MCAQSGMTPRAAYFGTEVGEKVTSSGDGGHEDPEDYQEMLSPARSGLVLRHQ